MTTMSVVESKPWYQSKTMWANLSAIVGAVGVYVMTGETTLLAPAALAAINLLLRYITKQPLDPIIE